MAGEQAKRIGARIAQRRVEMGLNQRELAARLPSDAVNNQRVSDWERGVHKPNEQYLEQLAEALDVDLAWFYETAESRQGSPDLMAALSDRTQLDRVEAKLDAIMAHLDISLSADPAADVEQAIMETVRTSEQLPGDTAPVVPARRTAAQ